MSETIKVLVAGKVEERSLQQILQEIVAHARFGAVNWWPPCNAKFVRRELTAIKNGYIQAAQFYHLSAGSGQQVHKGLGTSQYEGPTLPSEWLTTMDELIGQLVGVFVQRFRRKVQPQTMIGHLQPVAAKFGCTIE